MSKGAPQMYNMIAMRQKKKLKMLATNNSAVTLQVLGSGAPGSPVCVFMTTDHANYMFNCGEGSQRLSQEYHCKLSKLDHVFVTRTSWKNIGGLPGILLTIQEAGVSEINIHSADGISDLLDTVKKFVFLPNLNISYQPINESEPYRDNITSVWYVPIMKSPKNIDESSAKLVGDNQYSPNVNGKRVLDTEDVEEGFVRGEKKLKTITDVICFICEINPRHGKLLLDKCIESGIERGPLLKLLKEGLDVTKEDGTIVFSKDVCLPLGPKVVFIVVECPTNDYLDSIVNHSAFLKYQDTSSRKEEDEEVHCIFHFTPENVLNDVRYQDWMKKFSQNTQHIILNSNNSCIASEAVYKNQYLLHMLHPEIFPLLNEDCLTDDEETKNDNVHRAKTMLTLKLHPVLENITVPKICPQPQTYIDEVSKIPDFLDTLAELKTNIERTTTELSLKNSCEYPRILMIGTGSSTPNKIRNTSGILLRLDESNSIILDCGEGTLDQLVRFYGNSEIGNILCTIKAIYVSHMHADHHLGIIGLLQKRGKFTNDRVFLLAPNEIEAWLNFYHNEMEPISHLYSLLNNFDFYLNNHKLSTSFENIFYSILNIKEISTVFVTHCKHSYGVAVTLNDGKKIVYSGDTMPCKNLISLGKDCDLLIHEATMEDKLKKLALRKFHSTTSEAINAGKSMNAKFILLTHFSQRYSKIPILPEEETNVGLAYDNMDIKLSHLPLLPLFYPCLKLMFNEYYKTLEKRSNKLLLTV